MNILTALLARMWDGPRQPAQIRKEPKLGDYSQIGTGTSTGSEVSPFFIGSLDGIGDSNVEHTIGDLSSINSE